MVTQELKFHAKFVSPLTVQIFRLTSQSSNFHINKYSRRARYPNTMSGISCSHPFASPLLLGSSPSLFSINRRRIDKWFFFRVVLKRGSFQARLICLIFKQRLKKRCFYSHALQQLLNLCYDMEIAVDDYYRQRIFDIVCTFIIKQSSSIYWYQHFRPSAFAVFWHKSIKILFLLLLKQAHCSYLLLLMPW